MDDGFVTDAVRKLVDPMRTGNIPRRVVVSPETGLVCDITSAPHLPECEVLSEICSVMYNTEPRNPTDLVRRAFDDNIQTAWEAMRDDILVGYTFEIPQTSVRKWLYAGDELRVSVCCRLVSQKIGHIEYGRLASRPFTDDTFAALQHVVAASIPTPETVATLVCEFPRCCRMFLRYPRIVDLPLFRSDIGLKVCEYASTVDIGKRYPALAMASLVARAGAKIDPDIGASTLTQIRRSRIDIRLAAAAAGLAATAGNPTHRAMAGLIESLAAHIQSNT